MGAEAGRAAALLRARLRELACDAEQAGALPLPLLPARPLRVGAAGGTNGSWAASEAAGLRAVLSGSEVRVMDALLAEDVVAAQRRLLLRLLTHVPLLRNPSRQLPLLLRRQLGAAEIAPPEAGASGSKGSAADNGKRVGDLLPACIEALFAQQPAAGTSGASPDSCAAAQ